MLVYDLLVRTESTDVRRVAVPRAAEIDKVFHDAARGAEIVRTPGRLARHEQVTI